MKKMIVLTVACLLFFSAYASALDNSVGFRIPNPGGNTIRVIVQVTIPEDMQLVRKDGSVVKDEVCVGESFTLKDQTDAGDYWQDGGYEGDPPIHWTSDAKKVALSFNSPGTAEYNELMATQTYPVNLGVGGACLRGLNLTLGENTVLPSTSLRSLQGGLGCTLNKKDPVVSGAQKDGDDYYAESAAGEIEFNAQTDVDCFYYYTTESDAAGTAPPFAMGICGETTPLLPIEQTSLIDATGNPDNFNVGTIKFSKKVKVVDQAKPDVELDVIGGDNLKTNEENTVKVRVKNKGDVDVSIQDVKSSASNYRFIACESMVVKPGEQKECLVSVTLQAGESAGISLNYQYKSCGKTSTKVAYEAGADYRTVAPTLTEQVYRIDVHGACENTYYGCSAPDKDGKFYAGGKCYDTDDQYYSPAAERFALGFYLPSELAGKTITSARLKTFVSGVERAQEIAVYSGTNAWAEASCVAGGDICAKPGCETCAPLFELAGEQVTSQIVQSQSSVSFDVTEAVRKAYAGGKATLSLQLRGSEENRWASDGKNACAIKGNWETYDIAFYGKGANQPYLEIVYR